MTPEQALQILDQATGEARLSRQDHISVQEAIKLLANIIVEHKELKEEKEIREKEEKTKIKGE